MSILIFIEHDNQVLKKVSYHAVKAAQHLNQEVDILIVGYQCEPVVQEATRLAAIRRIFVADAEMYQHQLAENTALLLAAQARNYHYLMATASTFSKNILPRVAALLDVNMISDVVEIMTADTFKRPMFAGNVLATVKSLDPIKILTVRGTAFPVSNLRRDTLATVERIAPIIPWEQSCFIKQNLTISGRPELTSARIVLSGGRGFKSAENFKLLEDLADLMGAAIGASRAAVDAGYAPNDYQVGQTGKIVAPDLYIAIGISGAIQHIAGMKDSKVIVAINNDSEAAITQIADYILVGDLFDVLPALKAELIKYKQLK